jgi:uncharacterized protein (TIGR02246 family)
LVLAIVAFAGAAACAPPPAPDTRAQDEAAIRAADEAWSAAAHARDLDKSVSFYAPDATTLPPNQPMVTGAANIRKAFGEMLAAPGLEIGWTVTKVEAAKGGDLGYSMGTYTMSVTGPDGKPMPDHGKYVTIWQKQADGSWKVLADTFNTDVPMPPPPPPPAAAKAKKK